MSKTFVFLVCVLTAVTQVGCSKAKSTTSQQSANESSPTPVNEDLVLMDLKLEIDSPEKLTPEQNNLVSKVNGGETVSFKEISSMWIDQHRIEYNERNKENVTQGDVENTFSVITAGIDTNDDHSIKIGYEDKLQKTTSNTLKYNLDSVSAVDLLKKQKMQCYSGTVLHQYIVRTLKGAKLFRSENHVVIFESGHILPGYVVKFGTGWRLYGVETTTDGRSVVDYGMTDAIATPIRVVDSELFTVVELFKGNIKNSDALMAELLQKTAAKYGFTIQEIKKEAPVSNVALAGNAKLGLNNTPFAFGVPKAVVGDQPRNYSSVTTKGGVAYIDPKNIVNGAINLPVSVGRYNPFGTGYESEYNLKKYLEKENEYLEEKKSRIESLKMEVSFSGQNIYSSGTKIVAGQVMGAGQSTMPSIFCGYFTIGGKQCWQFANPTYVDIGLGVISMGGNAVQVGQSGSLSGQSKYEPDSGITLVLTPTKDPLHSNVTGTINLSQAFVTRNFPQGVPPIIGIAIDIHNTGEQITDGAVLIYTGLDALGYHGVFLKM